MKSQGFEIFKRNFCAFEKTTSYAEIFKILFRKFTWRYVRSTLLCSNFIKFVRQEIGEIVRYLVDKKFRLPLKLAQLRGSRQNLPGPVPTMYS